MGIFLTILKIIGIALLIIVGILLLVLIIVLVAPVHYEGKADFSDGGANVHIKVGWLLFIRFFLDFVKDVNAEKEGLDYRLNLFGRKFFPKNRKEEDKEEEKTEPEKSEASGSDSAGSEKAGEDKKDEDKKEETEVAEAEKAGDEKSGEEADSDEEEAKEDEPKQSFVDKLAALFEKLVRIWENTMDAVEDTESKISLFFRRKTTRESKVWLKTALIKIGKHIRPKKLSGELEFGLDDPAATGYIAAGAAMVYDVYADTFELTPNFEEKTVKGKTEFGGRIILGYVVFIALRLYLRKHFRLFIKNARALKDDVMENIEKIKDGIVNYG